MILAKVGGNFENNNPVLWTGKEAGGHTMSGHTNQINHSVDIQPHWIKKYIYSKLILVK